MSNRGGGALDRRRKFAPDPTSPLEAASERIALLENEVRLLRQNLQVPTIHTFDRARYIDPTQGEIFWDFQFQRGYIWHHEKYRPLAPPTFHIKLFPDDKEVTTEKPFTFMISRDMGGYTPDTGEPYPSFYLYDAEAYVSAAGANTISVVNATTSSSMLSTPMTIDSGETTTRTATTERVIANVACDWGDLIRVEVDSAGGMGLGVILVFNPIIDET